MEPSFLCLVYDRCAKRRGPWHWGDQDAGPHPKNVWASQLASPSCSTSFGLSTHLMPGGGGGNTEQLFFAGNWRPKRRKMSLVSVRSGRHDKIPPVGWTPQEKFIF